MTISKWRKYCETRVDQSNTVYPTFFSQSLTKPTVILSFYAFAKVYGISVSHVSQIFYAELFENPKKLPTTYHRGIENFRFLIFQSSLLSPFFQPQPLNLLKEIKETERKIRDEVAIVESDEPRAGSLAIYQS